MSFLIWMVRKGCRGSAKGRADVIEDSERRDETYVEST